MTDMAAADLPQGVSPDCQDVAFLQGAVKTRPGLVSVFSPIAGNPTVNYLKTYTQPNLAQTLLALDSAGTLWGENSPGVLSQIAAGLAPNAAASSTSLFGREYIALHDGNFGLDMPRQYDGTNFDRVSQVGPGAGVAAIADIVANISAISRTAGVVTVTTTAPTGLLATDQVTIAGVTDTSFNGTFPIASIIDSLHFTYAQAGAHQLILERRHGGAGRLDLGRRASVRRDFRDAAGLSDAAFAAGVLDVDRRRARERDGAFLRRRVCRISWRASWRSPERAATIFTTRRGWTARRRCKFPTIQRLSFVVDFSDTALLAGISADSLFQLVELGECAGVIGYAERLFWWGERNKQNNWDNLTFDGGFGGAGFNVPLGWTPDATFFAGGSADSTGKAIWGGAYSILGDGATATRGLMTQSAVTDYNGAPRLQANTGYSARVRVRMTGALTQGTLHVHIYSASLGISTTGISVPAAQISSSAYTEFIAPLTPSGGFINVPPDLVLRVYADGTPTNGGGFLVENIEIFPTAEPYNTSLVRASCAEDPESYDGVSGFLNVSEDDGQAVRAAFLLRERLYFVKERSIYVTEDDGVNEPASWTINEVSRTVGTPSVAGVDTGEDWAVIAGRAGMYIFDGGEPVKISQEIQPLWDQINWAAGQTLWVRVDTRNKRILCGVPIGTATSPNRILVLDYRSLSSAGEIESLGSVLFSTLSGKLYAGGPLAQVVPVEYHGELLRARRTLRRHLADISGNGRVSGAGNGKIYQLSDTQFSDDGAAINSYYTTYFFLSHDLEQTYQVRSHRKLFAYLTCTPKGQGT